ncbi:hypothetical protein BCR33DRAFT_715618, partial [Rhizoclosmatium globosum]
MRFKVSQLPPLNLNAVTNSTDSMDTSESVQYTLAEMATLCTLAGLAIEISFSGLITITCRHVQRVSSLLTINNMTMVLFNITSVVYSGFCIWSLLLGDQGCSLISMTDTALGHVFYLFFDAFMLYKTYQVSHKNFYILCVIAVLMVNRFIWSVLDTMYSSAEFDPVGQLCVYTQNPWTGIGYNAADTIVDSFALVVAVAISLHKFDTWKHAYKAMVQKNILRSAIVISMDAFLVWANVNWTSQYLIWLCWLMQNYTLSRALNWDLFWIPESVARCTCPKKRSTESEYSSYSETSRVSQSESTKIPAEFASCGSDDLGSIRRQSISGYERSRDDSAGEVSVVGSVANSTAPLRTVQVQQSLYRNYEEDF